MSALSKAVDQAADELYELAPGEFTRARDERVRALRKDGRREEADGVKALRKPTLAAWALNQLARRRSKDVVRLLGAGEKLRAAQEELLAGGERSVFQRAASAERDQVAKLAAEATELAAEAGERPGPALQEKIAGTLHAAALDEDTAAELRAGRLVREREAIGGFGVASAAAPAQPRRRRETPAGGAKRGKAPGGDAKRTKAPGGDAKRGKAASGSAKRGKASSGSAKRGMASSGSAKRGKASSGSAKRGKASSESAKRGEARARETARRQRFAAARTDERHARRELDAATRATGHAETRADAAATHAAEAAQRAELTAERLKEARRAESAARKAHARAERALEAADS